MIQGRGELSTADDISRFCGTAFDWMDCKSSNESASAAFSVK
jgi:hypothetical protein